MPSMIKVHSMESNVSEGIAIDYANQCVSYNPKHLGNVDTSIEGNPTCLQHVGS